MLCFVDESTNAYFTTQKLKEADGLGWDEPASSQRPQPPYVWDPLNQVEHRQRKAWKIKKVAFDGGQVWLNARIAEGVCKRAVAEINRSAPPLYWMITQEWSRKNPKRKIIKIGAGTSLREFRKQIRRGGGRTKTEEWC